MRSIVAAAVAAACALIASAASAAERRASCKFTVDGKTIIDGRCGFNADSDGSFQIWDDVHTVYVNMDEGVASGFWNGIPKSLHADSPLGTLTRNGACWTNEKAQVCARSLPGRK
jgi:hypothetical protein